MNNNRWTIFNKDYSQLKDLNIDERILKVLVNRDINTKEDIDMFLKPSLDKFYDPFLMKDMDIAVDIILEAIEENKHIHIVGDYDQDGNSSIVTLMKGLGIHTDRLTYTIPDRMSDGYGINNRIVEEAAEMGVDLIITCDNGISAHEAVEKAKELEMEIIVTDHHHVTLENEEQILPKADAVINPHRLDCPYPFKELCGAGVAFKLIQAINIVLGIDEEETNSLLEFTCMGTICDIVDLVDENRIIVVEGLRRLNISENLGVKHLCSESAWDKEITAYTIGFVLGPCINASGRLSTARLGVELFLEEDEGLVQSYASELVRLNKERKELTEEAYEIAYNKVQSQGLFNKQVITLVIEDIHESIVGIVAGRIKDDFYRPTIIFTQAGEEGLLKGSGRSIEAYNMFEKIDEIRNLTVSFGGHTMAAGMSIKEEDYDFFDSILNEKAGLSKVDLQKKISIDFQQNISELDMGFINQLEKLGPFGKANPRPKLADKGVNILNFSLIGKNKNVLKVNFEKNSRVMEGISFVKAAETYEALQKAFASNLVYEVNNHKKNYVDLIYRPDINSFRGEEKIQLRIEDMRLSR